MNMSFLLRYQESTVEEFITLKSGTRTETKIRGEQSDTDPHQATCEVIPKDVDIAESILFQAHTQTKTANKPETDDKDYASSSRKIFPKCSW